MESPKISVIIPAYNASSTIVRCLDSIYALSLAESEYEVIVVDDCSQDNTVAVVEEYARKHSNLVLLRQPENHSLGGARNRGVSVAQGKYIVFVDSDDETAEGMIAAVRMAEENELDMVVLRYVKKDQEGNVEAEVSSPFEKGRMFSGIELQTQFPFWSVSAWSYIYKKSFLDQVYYPFVEDLYYEDSDFINVHLYHAKRMMYSDECGYIMHYNSASITHTISYRHLCDYVLLGTRMLRFYESLEDKTSQYAKGILDGGSYNIRKAFRKLPRLKSYSAVRSFYERFDAHYDRKQLLGYREPAKYWTRWTRLGVKHRDLCVFLLSFTAPFSKLFQM